MKILGVLAVALLGASLFPPPEARAGNFEHSFRKGRPTQVLSEWYVKVGAPLPAESFGEFTIRVALAKLGTPYRHLKENILDKPHVSLYSFDCVSYIEATIAVARCAWLGRPTQPCFVREVIASRYRNGSIGDYSSRLHYFVDWIGDNARRGRLRNLTYELGGTPVRRPFFHITQRQLSDSEPSVRKTLAAVESHLGAQYHVVIDRQQVQKVVRALEDGDLVAVVGDKPGRLVSHAGFIALSPAGMPRFAHASSHHRRVLVTRRDIADYILRRRERQGFTVARPSPPGAKVSTLQRHPYQ